MSASDGESFCHFEIGNSPVADVGFFLQIDRFVGFLLFSVFLLSSTTHAAERTLVSRSFSPITGLFELHGNRSAVLSFSRPFSASVDDSFSIGRARAIGRGRISCRAAFVRRSAPPFFVAHSRFHFVERSRCESTVSDERYALRRRSCKFLSLLFLFCRRSFVCFLLLRILIAKR